MTDQLTSTGPAPDRAALRAEAESVLRALAGPQARLREDQWQAIEALVADHHVVRVVDNFTTGKIENLAAVMESIELHPGDYCHPEFDFKVEHEEN